MLTILVYKNLDPFSVYFWIHISRPRALWRQECVHIDTGTCGSSVTQALLIGTYLPALEGELALLSGVGGDRARPWRYRAHLVIFKPWRMWILYSTNPTLFILEESITTDLFIPSLCQERGGCMLNYLTEKARSFYFTLTILHINVEKVMRYGNFIWNWYKAQFLITII